MRLPKAIPARRDRQPEKAKNTNQKLEKKPYELSKVPANFQDDTKSFPEHISDRVGTVSVLTHRGFA